MSREGILWNNLGISLSVYLVGMAISIAIADACRPADRRDSLTGQGA